MSQIGQACWRGGVTCLVVCALSQQPVFAELSPNQIIILSNENSADSQSVAEHYARQRGIPISHIVELDTSTKETIRRDEYEQSIAQPIREALEDKKLASTIRVIVSTYGIPLRVESPRMSQQEKAWVKDAKAWQESSAEFLQELKNDIDQIAMQESSSTTASSELSVHLSHSNLDQQAIELRIQEVSQAMAQAVQRIDELEKSNKKREPHEQVLKKIIQRVNGLAGKAFILQSASEKTAKADNVLDNIRTQLRSAEQLITFLQANPSVRGRERAYQVVQQHFGVVGVLRFAGREVERLRFRQADASVDSELSVLWWDRAYAHPSGKLPNPLYAWYPQQSQEQMRRRPVMMVSRLDGPNVDLAKQLIDHAVLAEKNGLSGKAYFDARGMDAKQSLSYGHYDRDIRTLSDLVQHVTSYPVVLENTQTRFSQSGDAPDVALYVGWYRLRHYEDAFSFNPGSIGYHIASGEAVSLRDPIERGWCKNALEHGITVTLGPIGEPYLDAFPLPTQFFGLLLTGRYSVVEAFYLSSRHVSWRMVLVGDPLYNPWRGKGLVRDGAITEKLKLYMLPVPPSERNFFDPVQIRKELREEREQIFSRLALSEKH